MFYKDKSVSASSRLRAGKPARRGYGRSGVRASLRVVWMPPLPAGRSDFNITVPPRARCEYKPHMQYCLFSLPCWSRVRDSYFVSSFHTVWIKYNEDFQTVYWALFVIIIIWNESAIFGFVCGQEIIWHKLVGGKSGERHRMVEWI